MPCEPGGQNAPMVDDARSSDVLSPEALTSEEIHTALDTLLERRDPGASGTVLGAGSDDLRENRCSGVEQFMHVTIMVGRTACRVSRAGRMRRWSMTLGVLRF